MTDTATLLIPSRRRGLRPRGALPILSATVLAALLLAPPAAHAQGLLAGYEPDETDLTVLPGGADAGLSLAIVRAEDEGLTATQGEYVLRLDIAGEDGKVEIAHQWSASTYDLAPAMELLVDVYIADPAVAPGLMGIWSANWNPPDAWQQAPKPAGAVGVWSTVSFDVSSRNQTNLNVLNALVFEDMPGSTGVIYLDNLRTSSGVPADLVATGHERRIDLTWTPAGDAALGYDIYRGTSAAGPLLQRNGAPHPVTAYSDILPADGLHYHYRVTTHYPGGESNPSPIVDAASHTMTDDELVTSVQQATFRYFWDFAHPTSGMAREGIHHDRDTVTTGGTGMGLMNIVVGAERGFVARAAAAERVRKILTFLDRATTRYHGAWSHHLNGRTGETIPFSAEDNGADLVETAFLVQGMLTIREYFDDPDDPVERDIRRLATDLWEGVDWAWFLKYPGSQLLYWHWSPDYGWDVAGTRPVIGYDETMITYLLAIASPTHPIPASCYYNGWTTGDSYINGNSYFGWTQWVGHARGGPLFWTHYSFLGFDPRNKHDGICNYYLNNQNISRINRAYCIDNPENHTDYGPLVWGLTTCFGPYGYLGYEPWEYRDDGTIAPTAALSATPYTPAESLATLRHFYDTYLPQLWGEYGFHDAFNPSLNWYSDTYIAIDQGPIAPMIENHRTGLCWRHFMANPEIQPMLDAIGWTVTRAARPADDPPRIAAGLDYAYYEAESSWNRLPYLDALVPEARGVVANFDISPRLVYDHFAFRFDGFIDVPTNGVYTFYLNSDDGSRLFIGDGLVVDYDGLHGMDGDVSGQIELLAGLHTIRVEYFDHTLDAGLTVKYRGPGIAKQLIPATVLRRDGTVHLADLVNFIPCLTGPNVPLAPACHWADFDGDGDADLADVMVFQKNLVP